jgi:hypothetical protein
VSVSAGVLLNEEPIQFSQAWVSEVSGEMNVALRVGTVTDLSYASIQGTPEDMDRLAAAATEAAARARAAEPELRAKATTNPQEGTP